MGTLTDILPTIRLKIKEKDVQYFSDADMILLANAELEKFRAQLAGYDCKDPLITLTLDLQTDLVSDINVITDKKFIEPKLVLNNSKNTIPRYTALLPDDFSYEEVSTGIKFYNYDEVTGDVFVSYRQTIIALTAVGDTIPFDEIWDTALQDALVLQCKVIRGHRFNVEAVQAQNSFNDAMLTSLTRYGTIRRQMKFAT